MQKSLMDLHKEQMIDSKQMIEVADGMNDGQVFQLLQEHARKVEYKLPLLMFKTEDDMDQVKHFMEIYYRPALTEVELQVLQADSKTIYSTDNIIHQIKLKGLKSILGQRRKSCMNFVRFSKEQEESKAAKPVNDNVEYPKQLPMFRAKQMNTNEWIANRV